MQWKKLPKEIKMKKRKQPPIYIDYDDGNEMEIISFDNHLFASEEEYFNNFFAEYVKKHNYIPEA